MCLLLWPRRIIKDEGMEGKRIEMQRGEQGCLNEVCDMISEMERREGG